MRMASLFAVGITAFLVLRWLMVPADFGLYGHFRPGALDDASGPPAALRRRARRARTATATWSRRARAAGTRGSAARPATGRSMRTCRRAARRSRPAPTRGPSAPGATRPAPGSRRPIRRSWSPSTPRRAVHRLPQAACAEDVLTTGAAMNPDRRAVPALRPASCWCCRRRRPSRGRRSSPGRPETAPNYTMTDHWWGMVIDIEVCIGCGNCVRACKEENDVPRDAAVLPHVGRALPRASPTTSSTRSSTRRTGATTGSRRRRPTDPRPSTSSCRSSATTARTRRACRCARSARPSRARTASCSSTRPTASGAATACRPARTAAGSSTRAPRRSTSARSATTGSRRA